MNKRDGSRIACQDRELERVINELYEKLPEASKRETREIHTFTCIDTEVYELLVVLPALVIKSKLPIAQKQALLTRISHLLDRRFELETG